MIRLPLRRRAEVFRGRGEWDVLEREHLTDPARTALVISDMWDRHWSAGMTQSVAALSGGVEALARALRDEGALVVHCPADTMEYYAGHPARERVRALPQLRAPVLDPVVLPPLPIDDSDGGSTTGETEPHRVWTRQHEAITIADRDAITDDADELYSLLVAHGTETVLVAGVATNMCVLDRPFGIKNLVGWQLATVLVRDLTDTMYNPAMPPHVSHDEGTRLVVEFIERHWCPSTTSAAIRASTSTLNLRQGAPR